MIYGEAGVGKTTLGAKADHPIFICPEGGADYVKTVKGEPVDEMPGIHTFDGIRNAVQQLTIEQHQFQTVVLDSADWIEKLCHAQIVGKSGKSITTCNGGYGAGYRQSEIMHKELIDDLSALRERKGMNIVITAHAAVRTVKDPSMMDDYESFEIKCHEMVSSLWREWVDALLFARFRTFINPAGDTMKARAVSDGSRIVYTVKQPSFQAKNRYGMAPEYPFSEDFWPILKKFSQHGVESGAQLLAEIELLLAKLKDDEKTYATVKKAVQDAGTDVVKLNAFLKRLKEITGEK